MFSGFTFKRLFSYSAGGERMMRHLRPRLRDGVQQDAEVTSDSPQLENVSDFRKQLRKTSGSVDIRRIYAIKRLDTMAATISNNAMCGDAHLDICSEKIST